MYKAYQQSQGKAAINACEQVAVVLESAARQILLAKAAIEINDIEQRFMATDKANAIISALANALEPNPVAPEAKALVAQMEEYYSKVLILLMDINHENDPVLCDKVVMILRHMANVWHHAGLKVEKWPEGHVESEA